MEMEYQNENFNGEFDFRSGLHGEWKVPLHLHEYSEFLYCKSGQARVCVQGQEFLLGEREFVFVSPNMIHSYECTGGAVVCAVFSNDFIPLFSRALAGKSVLATPIRADELAPIMERFYLFAEDDMIRVGGYLCLICDKVLKNSILGVDGFADSVLYQKVISYLSEHYAESVTLSEVARIFGYNVKYLSHALHSLTGMNFRQLVNFYRIRHAKRLLLGCERKSIIDVAMESGFSALNTFHRAFREMTGETPMNYRKKFK